MNQELRKGFLRQPDLFFENLAKGIRSLREGSLHHEIDLNPHFIRSWVKRNTFLSGEDGLISDLKMT